MCIAKLDAEFVNCQDANGVNYKSLTDSEASFTI